MRKPISIERVIAEVDLATIRRNLARISAHARARYNAFDGAVAMVKANGYGHGLTAVAKAVERSRETMAIGVASFAEAAALREARVRKPVWVFSDAAPWTSETQALALRLNATPVFSSLESLKAFLSRSGKNLKFHLKFNTGMNRLGFEPFELREVHRLLEKSRRRPEGICTHLAIAENPEHSLSREQVERFKWIVASFIGTGVSHIHCANSAGVFSEDKLRLGKICNLIRPGVALYGYGGEKGERAGLRPAMKLKARVLLNRRVFKGESVGYGATFKATSDLEESVLAIGYGDGFSRALSNGEVLVDGRLIRVMGRVSMDLISLNCRAKPGSWVTLLGQNPEQAGVWARRASTIEYEVLTSISERVPRIYSNND